jgi:hypothetical protein
MDLIIEKPGRLCPGPECTEQLCVDSMIPANKMRKLVHEYQVEEQRRSSTRIDPSANVSGYRQLQGRKRAYA